MLSNYRANTWNHRPSATACETNTRNRSTSWTGEIELVGSEGTIATFDDPQEITGDVSAYPRTESEIGDGRRVDDD